MNGFLFGTLRLIGLAMTVRRSHYGYYGPGRRTHT